MIRLYLEESLEVSLRLILRPQHSHYLTHVMRLKPGQQLEVFNGKDGGWTAEYTGGKTPGLVLLSQRRPQPDPLPVCHLYFSLFKRWDWAVEKSTEMGVTHLHPILSRYSTPRTLNVSRCQRIIQEACEQSGRYALPLLMPLQSFAQALQDSPPGFVGDTRLWNTVDGVKLGQRAALWIGPEGGWSSEERAAFHQQDRVLPLRFSPLCLRSETAVVAGLALMQQEGHWKE